MNVEMINVESTRVEAIGYDDNSATLYVRFKKGGSTYAYYDVPRYEFEDFFTGISIGRKISEIDKIYHYSPINMY